MDCYELLSIVADRLSVITNLYQSLSRQLSIALFRLMFSTSKPFR